MNKLPGTMLIWCLVAGVGALLLMSATAVLLAADDAPEPATIELFPPTGPLPLGRTSYHWVDDSRESHGASSSATPSAKREVMVHLWYPARQVPGQTTAPYIPGFAAIAATLGEDHLRAESGPAYDGLASARTHVVADAELSSDSRSYPVLLLAHGLRFSSLGYSMLAEELASHGYIVVGTDHPSTALAVLFPDQRVTRFDEAAWTRHVTREETLAFEQDQANRCAEDLVFVLDQLERLQSGALPSQFQRRLDLERVGTLGHSFGGRVVARACQLDERLKAGVILDGFGRTMFLERRPDGSTVAQPMMIQYAVRVPNDRLSQFLGRLQNGGKDLEEELRPVRKEFCESVRGPSYEVVLKMPGVSHESFSDVPLLESDLSAEARPDRQRTMQTIRDYTRAFFDRHVLGRPAPRSNPRPSPRPTWK